jgi:Tfp pilus assembly protein PilN
MARRLHWNFAKRRWWAQPSTIVCVVALAGCLHALWWRHDLLQRREHIIEEVQAASQREASRERRVAVPPSVALNQVFVEMRFPWTEMLDSLQRVTKPGLDLLTLEPDAGSIRRVHVNGVADETQDVFDLVTALQSDRAWSSVQLISQTRSDNTVPPRGNSNGTVPLELPISSPRRASFSLLAEWGRP